MKPLDGQIALVTGGSSGIGAAVVLALAEAGAKVGVNYHRGGENANQLVQQIKDQGGDAIAIQGDVSQEEDVLHMFQTVKAQYGTLDILVNNAGIQKDNPFIEMSLDDWNKVIAINLTGQFLCTREAIKEFLQRGVVPDRSCAAGKIICMSSVHEEIPWAGHVNYAASKGGIKLMMESVAQEYAPQKIRVNSIAPGAIKTPINREAWETPEAREKLLQLIPYQRIGEPEDIGKAAVWLASDASDYVTGTTLYVDGGMTLYPGFSDNG